MHVDFVLHWGNKEWLAVHYGEFEEARGWAILNNARAERVHYSESPTRVLTRHFSIIRGK